MTLHISEDEVRSLLTMPMAVEAVEDISRKQATGEVVVHPRRRFEFKGGNFFHYMAAADHTAGFIAMKQYTYVRGHLQFIVPLYEMSTGNLLALIEADYMGQLRTGAASGVATKYMASRDAKSAAIIGTGGQAKTQLEGIAAVRQLEIVHAYGRDPVRREAFCLEMSVRLGIPVHAAASASEAVRAAHIVCTATTAQNPVIKGADLETGVHINAIGANHANRRELDDEAVASADVIVVDSVEQSRQEAGDLIIAFHGDESCWTGVKRLSDVVAGKVTGRTSDSEATLFKSNGIASWDLAVAIKVYKAAREKKLGRELPLWNNPQITTAFG
ncbi:MAG TPA: ornithine cyclodeaminase family protein [Candidatus Acidoferrum sp.]|jgi:alanine dehydrogenase|nr:ornithine cyclodeaminase family protein [Candidatus Acidoferrum sp.]